MPIALLARKKFQFIFPRPNFALDLALSQILPILPEIFDLFIFDRQLDFRAEDT